MPTPDQVADRAQSASNRDVNWGVGMCLKFSRTCAGAAGGVYNAATAWKNAKHKHTTGTPPRGSFVFWLGGSKGHGHVAVSDGRGYVWSTDLKRPGLVDRVSLAYVKAKWPSQTYVGWTEDINGVHVTEAAPAPVAAAKPKRVHVVRKGDSLWEIAEAVYGDGTQWKKIAKANGLGSGNNLSIGQRLTLP